MKSLFLIVLIIFLSSCKEDKPDVDSTVKSGKVMVIGHFYPLWSKNNLRLLSKKIIEMDDVKKVILASDFIPEPTPGYLKEFNDSFSSILAENSIDIFYLPGNHESIKTVYSGGKPRNFFYGNNYENLKEYNISIGNLIFFHDNIRYILFSDWNYRFSDVNGDYHQPSDKNHFNNYILNFFKNAIQNRTSNFNKTILVLADLQDRERLFNGSNKWKKIIEPIIKDNIDYVIIGDNEKSGHNYIWEEFQGVKYIFQGMTNRDQSAGGAYTYILIDKDKLSLKHLNLTNSPFDDAYRNRGSFFD